MIDPEKIRSRQDLLYLLTHAAEIEHSLCCQYLYAAFSLKQQGDPGVTDDEAAVIAHWRATLIDISVQEMLHLGLVSNLLTAIGGAPNMRKPNFPQAATYSSIGLDFRLAPVSEETLRRFACFELPPTLEVHSRYRAWPVQGRDPVDWAKVCECLRIGQQEEMAEAHVPPLLPNYFGYTSVGELYELISTGFKSLFPDDESALFIGPPQAQTAEMWQEMLAVTDRKSALQALDTIIREGEGAFGDDDDIAKAHFGRFVDLWTQLVEGQGGDQPALDVVENPVVAGHKDLAAPPVPGTTEQPWRQATLVTAEVSREANEIFVGTYELSMHILQRYFAGEDESEEQRYILKQVFLSLMRFCLAPLGTAIARLPAFEGQDDGPRCGASFELFSSVSLLPRLSGAWRYFAERLDQLTAAARKLAESDLASPYPGLQQALAGVPNAPALPGLANVCEQYATLMKVGLNAPEKWTWENGIRSFFSPLDVLRMGSWITSEKSVRANIDQIVLRITGTGGVTSMPPPYQLGDTSAPQRYRNPEGQWTIERISTFIEWAAQPPAEAGATYPDNPTWYNAIKDMFTEAEIKCMKRMASLDLGDYDQVSAHAEEIYAQVESGSMPPTEPWKPDRVACFKKWLDDGTPKGEPPALRYDWAPTGAPMASSRYDDIWFIDEDTGWAINSNGHILHTTDGGDHWVRQFQSPIVDGSPVYLRCIAFAHPTRGWVGTFSKAHRLYETRDGETWAPVENLPEDAPVKLCGMSVIDENVIYFSGTNEPEDHARVLKTTDGGNTWSVIDMADHATLLVDCHFWDENNGVVVGGLNRTGAKNPGRPDVKPVILFTGDGGKTWEDRLAPIVEDFPLGEWGWKIDFVDRQHGFVSLENYNAGAIARTTDGGKTWVRLSINDAQQNVNLEGIGFIDEHHGWVGGWGNMTGRAGYTSVTTDGGASWQNANEVGLFLNRFRFFGDPVRLGYASGITVYKLVVSGDAAPPPQVPRKVAEHKMLTPQAPETFTDLLRIPVDLPDGLSHAALHVWDHFGREMATLLDEDNPAPGPRTITWDGRHNDGETAGSGIYIYRLTTDNDAESATVRHVVPSRHGNSNK